MENTQSFVMEFEKALLQINRMKAAEIFEACYNTENDFNHLEQLAIQSLERIGDSWEKGLVSLSQVYMSGIICEELIDKYMMPLPIQKSESPRIGIGVLLDHHALGKRIVCSVLRAGGYEVIDLGQGLSVEELVAKTMENQIEILLISTLMLPSALKVKEVRKQLSEKGADVQIVAGGAPFRLDKKLWQTVGADADGKNASSVIPTIQTLMKGVE